MSTVISSFVSINCDALGCDKNVTFAQTEAAQAEALQEHPWLNSIRFVSTPDGRKFNYCSDTCEAKGIELGTHNKLEPKRIIADANPVSVNLAAQAAEQARLANEKLRQGQPVTVHQA